MIKKTVIGSVRQTLTLALLLSGSFIILEPALGAAAGSQFTTSETVTSELSFATPASNVTLSPALGGITGGTATGQTQVVVLTNDALGYQMTIQASSSLGMIGNASSTNYIAAYVPASTIPDYTFAVNSPRGAAFGYTVAASTTGDIAKSFLNNGSACNITSGTGNTGSGTQHCWQAATTTPYTIINRNYLTPGSGSTSTLLFQVTINANPAATIPNDTYVATTTLTATAN